MPPDDPLGRHGPSLENFLRKRPVIPEHRKQPCPYGNKKKCLVMFLIKCMLISYAAEDVCSCIVELDKKLYENKCFLFQYNDKKTSHFFFH